jgi:hypothetical protein
VAWCFPCDCAMRLAVLGTTQSAVTMTSGGNAPR